MKNLSIFEPQIEKHYAYKKKHVGEFFYKFQHFLRLPQKSLGNKFLTEDLNARNPKPQCRMQNAKTMFLEEQYLHTESCRSFRSYKYILIMHYQSPRNSYNMYTFMIRSNLL